MNLRAISIRISTMKTPAILFASLCVLCGHAVAAEFDTRDEAEFRKCVPAAAKLEKIAGDLGFSDLKNSRHTQMDALNHRTPVGVCDLRRGAGRSLICFLK